MFFYQLRTEKWQGCIPSAKLACWHLRNTLRPYHDIHKLFIQERPCMCHCVVNSQIWLLLNQILFFVNSHLGGFQFKNKIVVVVNKGLYWQLWVFIWEMLICKGGCLIFMFLFFWLIALIHLINNVDFQCNKIKEILYFSPYLLFTPAIIFFFCRQSKWCESRSSGRCG